MKAFSIAAQALAMFIVVAGILRNDIQSILIGGICLILWRLPGCE